MRRVAASRKLHWAINATDYNYRRVQWGGVQQYDFNLSANIDDRIYAGVTFGVYNVNMTFRRLL